MYNTIPTSDLARKKADLCVTTALRLSVHGVAVPPRAPFFSLLSLSEQTAGTVLMRALVCLSTEASRDNAAASPPALVQARRIFNWCRTYYVQYTMDTTFGLRPTGIVNPTRGAA